MLPKEGLQCRGIKGSKQNITRIPLDLAIMEQVQLRVQVAQKQGGKRKAMSSGYSNG